MSSSSENRAATIGDRPAGTERAGFSIMFRIAAGLSLFIVAAFAIASIVQPIRLERFGKHEVILHIVLTMGWLGFFLLQSRLISAGSFQRHRGNVTLGAILVLTLSIQGVLLVYHWGNAVRFVGETRDVMAFVALFIASIWAARRGMIESHKRWMLIGTLNLASPAIMRLAVPFEWSPPLTVAAFLVLWSIPAILYDRLMRRSIHRATIIGVVFSIATFALVIAIIASPLIEIVERFIGD